MWRLLAIGAAVVSSGLFRMDSIENPQLNDDPGAITAFTDEICGLSWCQRGIHSSRPFRPLFVQYSVFTRFLD
jgi:hypothetical protein